MRIRTAGPEDVPGILGLSDALFREDNECRDPTTNLEWARQKVEGGYSEELLADDAAACWLAKRVPGADAIGYLADRLCEADSLPLESMYIREVQGPRRGSEAGRLGRKLPQHTDPVTAAEVRPTLPWREHLARRPVSQESRRRDRGS